MLLPAIIISGIGTVVCTILGLDILNDGDIIASLPLFIIAGWEFIIFIILIHVVEM